MGLLGLTPREMVALSGRPRSGSRQVELGFSGSWTKHPSRFSNEYFTTLLNEEWMAISDREFMPRSIGKGLYMTDLDLAIRYDAELQAIAQEYASNNDLFLEHFAFAWTKLMNIDRFLGPVQNVCYKHNPSTPVRVIA